jgi:hypothetical protein
VVGCLPSRHKTLDSSLSTTKEKEKCKPGGVAHVCNLSYSGGRDQKDHRSKPAWVNSSRDPISKNPITKNWAGGVAQGEGPEFKPQY